MEKVCLVVVPYGQPKKRKGNNVNSKNVLWQIGLAILVGFAAGYLITVKFGIIAGLVLGTMLAFVIADPQSLRNEGPVMWRGFKKGFLDEDGEIRGQYITQGVRTRTCVTVLLPMILTVEAAAFAVGGPTLLFWAHFPTESLELSLVRAVLLDAMGIFGIFFLAMFIDKLPKKQILTRWPLLRKMNSVMDWDAPVPAGKKVERPLLPIRDTADKVVSLKRVLIEVGIMLGLLLFPVSSVLLPVAIAVFILDALLTMFLSIANSRNMAAGITTFVGILLEYLLYPSMEATSKDIIRFAAFSVGGALTGVLLYHWRTRLLVRQTAEELALAS